MKSKKKIVYTISTFGHGKGGHFNSLHTVACELCQYFDVTIVNIGIQPSPILGNSTYNLIFLPFDGKKYIELQAKFNMKIKEEKPIILNAFDIESFAFVRVASKKFQIPAFHTKCGGPNPMGYFPKVKNLILFSSENRDWFSKTKKHSKSSFYVIANRVKKIKPDADRIEEFFKKHKIDIAQEKIILRIARIGEHYKTSIEQGIHLTKYLRNQKIPVKFVVLGEVQDLGTLQKIEELVSCEGMGNWVIIESSRNFTFNASGLLPMADLVIGSGRNFMEASSLNLPLTVTHLKHKYPLFVNNRNFNEVYARNFSPRTTVKFYDEKENLVNIKNVFEAAQIDESVKWFNSYFNVEIGGRIYSEIYSKYKMFFTEKLSFDLILNVIYTILRFRKHS